MQKFVLSHTRALSYPFKPEFTIVIFIHYKPRIAVEDEDDLKCMANEMNIALLLKPFHENF